MPERPGGCCAQMVPVPLFPPRPLVRCEQFRCHDFRRRWLPRLPYCCCPAARRCWPWPGGGAETSHFQAPVEKDRPAEKGEPKGDAAKRGTAPDATPVKPADAPVAMPYSEADARRQQAMMAQLRQLRATDPAAEDELLGRLQRSDPSLWPLVVEQFRATLAYRKEMERAPRPTARGACLILPHKSSGFRRSMPGWRTARRSAPAANGAVQQASYAAGAGGSGAQRLAGAIAALKRETPAMPKSPATWPMRKVADALHRGRAARRRREAHLRAPRRPYKASCRKKWKGWARGSTPTGCRTPACGRSQSKPALSEALVKLGDSARCWSATWPFAAKSWVTGA